MPKTNKTRYAILGILSLWPGSGYDIKAYCTKSISHFWNENFGHIYPMLKQLENEGLITKKAEHTEGKPPRNVYSITEAGRTALADWLVQPIRPEPVRLELPLKLTFAKNIPPEKMVETLEELEQKHTKRLEQYKLLEKEFLENEKLKSDESYPYWLSTLRYGIYDAQFRLCWYRETIDTIKEYKMKGK